MITTASHSRPWRILAFCTCSFACAIVALVAASASLRAIPENGIQFRPPAEQQNLLNKKESFLGLNDGGGVSCGEHRAPSCPECGTDRLDCGFDCAWQEAPGDGKDGGGSCVWRNRRDVVSENRELRERVKGLEKRMKNRGETMCGSYDASSCLACGHHRQCHGNCTWIENGGKKGGHCAWIEPDVVGWFSSELEKLRKKMQTKKYAGSEVRATSEDRVEFIYRTLKVVVETMRRAEAEGRIKPGSWWANGGTLVGAKRCRPPGMMRWDHDLDLAVRAEDLEAVHEVLSHVKGLMWTKHHQFLAYKYGWAAAPPTADQEKKPAFAMDVFGLGLKKNSSNWHLMESTGRSLATGGWDFEFFTEEEINTVHPCTFWDITLNCPIGANTHLTRTFGKKVYSQSHVFYPEAVDEPTWVDLEGQNLNQHGGYFPAMTRSLMEKLVFNAEKVGNE